MRRPAFEAPREVGPGGAVGLYHVTLWSRVSWLVTHGIRPHVRSPWRNTFGGRIASPVHIYAWETEQGAFLWAAKMIWEFGIAVHKPAPLVAIVAFQDDPDGWEPDPSPTLLSRDGLRKQGTVSGDQLTGVKLAFPWEIRAAVQARNATARRIDP